MYAVVIIVINFCALRINTNLQVDLNFLQLQFVF